MTQTIHSPESVGCSPERSSRINSVMQSYVDRRGFAGISTMIARRGRVIHFEQVGWQDRESRTPLAPDTIFRIYSMTKPIVCVALMTLFEEARFQLFDPVAKFLPAFGKLRVLTGKTAADAREVDLVRPMTIRDVFTHTSGLTYGFLEDSPVNEMYRQARLMSEPGHSLEAVIGELARLPLACQPGTKWNYSMSTDVAGHLIEVISGKPLQQFLLERLFEPLGMTDTAFALPADKQGRIAAMYGHADIISSTLSSMVAAWKPGASRRMEIELSYPSDNTRTFARGGYGLFSTASDYMRFAQMLLNRGELDGVRILGPKTADLMHMNHLP